MLPNVQEQPHEIGISKWANRPHLSRAADSGVAVNSILASTEIGARCVQIPNLEEDSPILGPDNGTTAAGSAASEIGQFPCEVAGSSDMLALVGLNVEMQNLWEYRIAGFLCWPEEPQHSCLTPSSPEYLADGVDAASVGEKSARDQRLAPNREAHRPFFSFVRTTEGASLLTTIRSLKRLFPTEDERNTLLHSEGELDIEEGDSSTYSFSEEEGGASSPQQKSSTSFVISGEIDDVYCVASLGQGNSSTGNRENDLLVNVVGSHMESSKEQPHFLDAPITRRGGHRAVQIYDTVAGSSLIMMNVLFS